MKIYCDSKDHTTIAFTDGMLIVFLCRPKHSNWHIWRILSPDSELAPLHELEWTEETSQLYVVTVTGRSVNSWMEEARPIFELDPSKFEFYEDGNYIIAVNGRERWLTRVGDDGEWQYRGLDDALTGAFKGYPRINYNREFPTR